MYDCIARMSEHDFGFILVMDGDNIEGIFTERDYMHDLVLEGRSSEETEVQVVMTDDVATVDPETQLEDCLDLMTEIECRHLPVVDEDGQLTDIISMRDCALQISEAAKSEALQLRNFSRAGIPCGSSRSLLVRAHGPSCALDVPPCRSDTDPRVPRPHTVRLHSSYVLYQMRDFAVHFCFSRGCRDDLRVVLTWA